MYTALSTMDCPLPLHFTLFFVLFKALTAAEASS